MHAGQPCSLATPSQLVMHSCILAISLSQIPPIAWHPKQCHELRLHVDNILMLAPDWTIRLPMVIGDRLVLNVESL